MSVKFSNNAQTTLAANINTGATSFTVVSTTNFPTLGGSDWTYISLSDEVVKVTDITGTTFTCEATTGAHTSGERVELRMTAQLLNDFLEDTEGLPLSGGILTGDLTAPNFIGNLDGAVASGVKNGGTTTLLKGTPVYQTSTAGNNAVVEAADASNASTMPAIGVLAQDLTAGQEVDSGGIIHLGFIKGVDTSSFSEGDTIYVAVGGGYTNVAPTGEGNLIQNLGKVIKVHASNGSGIVMGAGRSNATPNLNDGNVFIGNASNQSVARALQIADTTGLQTALDGKTTESYVDTAVAGLVDSAPTTLDTLNELASALGDDPNYATTTSTLIGTKANSADVYTKTVLDGGQLDNRYFTETEVNTLLSGKSDTTHNHNGTYEPADATIVKDADIGVTVQAYDANLVSDATYVKTDQNFTTADHSKLDGIEAGATADQSASEIKTAYESNADTNEFSDAEKTKLGTVATSANNYTHPATHTISEVSGLQTALDGKSATSHNHTGVYDAAGEAVAMAIALG